MSGKLSRLLRSLFVPGSTRARAGERWVWADPHPSGAYNHQLMRSRAEGDFVRHPDLLWSPTPYWTARSGLNAHVRELAERLDGAVYSDVLIVLHPDDHARTKESWLASWEASARDELADCWARLVESQGWTLAVPGRTFHVKVVPDGDPAVGDLQLEPGEFVTALLPNLYLGADDNSAPLVEVFGRTDDGAFRSLGTMYTDQLAFTVGSHPLDNGVIAELGDSAVYTVHRFPGAPGLHHKLCAERVGRLALETGEAHGCATVRVMDKVREKLLLEVMLASAKHPAAELEVRGRNATVPRDLPGFGLIGSSPPAGTILPEGTDLGTLGAVSIIPDAMPAPLHTLSERAVLLQRVHFKDLMSGYRMELERTGRVVPRSLDSVGTFEVVDDRIRLLARARDLTLDGRPLRAQECVELRGLEHTIAWRGGRVAFRSLRRSDPRWPYLARLESPRRSVPLFEGTYVVGRDREACDVTLPDRPTSENILWRDGEDRGPVDVRGGATDRKTFRTDAIYVATRAASLDLTGDVAKVANLSRSCPIHILRADATLVRLKNGAEMSLGDGDELLIGNSVFALVPPSPAFEGGDGVAGVPRSTQIGPAPMSQRLENGPGGKGRRPLVGGARGRLVASGNTYAALLGMSPATDRTVQPEPTPVSLSLDPTTFEASSDGSGEDGYDAFGPGLLAEPGPTRADDWLPPSIPLLSAVAEVVGTEGEPESVTEPVVIAEASVVEAPRALHVPKLLEPPSAMGLVEDDADELLTIVDGGPELGPGVGKHRPPGLQIGLREPQGGFGTMRRRSAVLPGLSHLLPPRPSPGVLPSISTQGD